MKQGSLCGQSDFFDLGFCFWDYLKVNLLGRYDVGSVCLFCDVSIRLAVYNSEFTFTQLPSFNV